MLPIWFSWKKNILTHVVNIHAEVWAGSVCREQESKITAAVQWKYYFREWDPFLLILNSTDPNFLCHSQTWKPSFVFIYTNTFHEIKLIFGKLITTIQTTHGNSGNRQVNQSRWSCDGSPKGRVKYEVFSDMKRQVFTNKWLCFLHDLTQVIILTYGRYLYWRRYLIVPLNTDWALSWDYLKISEWERKQRVIVTAWPSPPPALTDKSIPSDHNACEFLTITTRTVSWHSWYRCTTNVVNLFINVPIYTHVHDYLVYPILLKN